MKASAVPDLRMFLWFGFVSAIMALTPKSEFIFEQTLRNGLNNWNNPSQVARLAFPNADPDTG
jgi:hypothetical protein